MRPAYSFAYGSNTDAADWRDWCARHGHDPSALRPVGTGLMPDAQLRFDFFGKGRGGGVLNFQPRLGGYVEGVLLEVTEPAWRALDQKEGVPQAYQPRLRQIITATGNAEAAIAYQVRPERCENFVTPSAKYVEIICRGFATHGLNTAPVVAAARNGEGCHVLSDVFVYGTLMQGGFWHGPAQAAGITAITPAHAQGRLHDLGDYPALTLADRAPVQGEILTFRDIAAALPILDEIEDAAPEGADTGMYRRTIITATDTMGQTRRAWAYVMSPERLRDAPIITTGDWRRR
jgi:gamma-glutamylcyclotransferase (GGCT)/AIG2-like uncharacterized protein YtfP